MKLYKIKTSKYWWLDHTFPNGDRIRESTKQTDKTVAKIRAVSIVKQFEKRERIIATKGSFFAEYLNYARPRKNKKTIVGEIRVWDRFIKFVGTDQPIAITELQVEQFFTEMLKWKKTKLVNKKKTDAPLSIAYINGYHRILKMLFNKAVRWNYAISNPLLNIEVMRYEPAMPRFLTQRELTDFFTSARTLYPNLVPLFQIYFLTGMRRSEATNLSWSDIDFERGLITVKNTKGKRARFVPMTPMVKQLLMARKGLIKPFTDNTESITHQFTKIAAAAKLEGITLHDLRRSFATHLAPRINKTILQQLMGHEDYSVTDVFYIGSNSDAIRGDMQYLDMMLLEVKNKN